MGLPAYVVNWEELNNLIKDYLQNGVKVDVGNIVFDTKDMEKLLNEIKDKIQGIDYNDLIKALNALGVKLDGLSGNLGISGTQKIYGEHIEIPASSGVYTIEFEVPKNGKLTGITYSQTAWRIEDNWSLKAKEEMLFNKVRTKEFGEHKYFNVFYPVKKGDIVQFLYNNLSGSNKTVWVDFDLLEDA